MSSPELRDYVVFLRLDAVAFVAAAAGGLWMAESLFSRSAATTREPGHPAEGTAAANATPIAAPIPVQSAVRRFLALTIVVATVGVAEWLGHVGTPADDARNLGAMLSRRLAVFALGSGFLALLLQASFQYQAGLARLRRHVTIRRRSTAGRLAAERANSAKTEFLVTLTHELRTPVNALLATARHVSRNPVADDLQPGLATITREAERLGKLLEDVLDLRHIEDGQLPLEKLPFSPDRIACDAIQLFAAPAGDKGIELTVESDLPADMLLAGDERRCRQVVIELLDHALALASPGVVTIRLRYDSSPANAAPGMLRVQVQQTSRREDATPLLPGLDAATAPARRPPPRPALAVVREWVRLMGGTLHLEGATGPAFDFRFCVPALPIFTDAGSTVPSPAAGLKPRILIVDDVGANRLLLQMYLQRQGFAAEEASDGEDAVARAGRERFDAILLDIQMPEPDGYTVAQRIRSNPGPSQHALIFAVTASMGLTVRQKCLAAGMDEYFSKPVELRKLTRALTNLLAARSTRAGSRKSPHVTRRYSVPTPRTVQ